MFSVVVWTLALVGLASVASTMASPEGPEPEPPISMLSPPADGDVLAGFEVPGLDHMNGFVITAYRQVSREGQLITEVEYAGPAEVGEVREFYRVLFERHGWTFREESALGPKSTDSVNAAADRHGTVEIDRTDGATEVSIELFEPAPARDVTTDR